MTEEYLHIRECRALGYCVHGVRRFCRLHDLDFKLLLEGKMPVSAFEATGDALALRLIEYTREVRE